MAYVAEACYKIYADSATVSPETERQGVAVQGRTDTFQWIFLHNIFSLQSLGGVDLAQKMTFKCFCNTWIIYYLKI